MDNIFDLDAIRNTISDMGISFIEFIPKLLGAIVILLIGWLISRLIAKAIEKIAERIGLEKILESTGLAGGIKQAGVDSSGSEMLAKLIQWIVFLNFLLLALNTIDMQEAVAPLQSFITFLPSILVAIVLLIVGSMVAQFIGKVIDASLASAGVDIHETLGNIVQTLMMVVVIIIVVQQLGVDAALMEQVFIAILIAIFAGLALAFGLGGRHVTRSVLAGFYAREMFHTGDRLKIDDIEGTLSGIGTLNAEVETADGRLVIPNTHLTESAVQVRDFGS